jgi:hypothetical protein
MSDDKTGKLRVVEAAPRSTRDEHLRNLANEILDWEEFTEERFQKTGRRSRYRDGPDKKRLTKLPGGYDIYVNEKEKRDRVRAGLGLINNILMASNREDLVNTQVNVAQSFVEKGLADPTFPKELERFIMSHFARVNEADLPPIPERKFQAREDDIIDFLRDVWGEWLDRGLLTKAILRNADRNAVIALNNWLRPDAGNVLPEDIDIPGQAEANDRFLARGYFTTSEVHRASGALTRRQP